GETGPEGVGFISDDHIDVLLATHRIAFAYSDKGGPYGENHEGVKAAFLLGADRMSRVLALPVDPEKRVSANAIDSLPLGLRARVASLALLAPIPLAQLDEKMIPAGLDYRGWRSARPPRHPLTGRSRGRPDRYGG